MNRLRKWFIDKRNECSVTYSRFGVPGDVVDDRPLPSTIYIARFDENDPKFMFFKLCHAQKAALIVAGLGMSLTILIFISLFFEFNWYSHKTGIDVMALAFLLLYLGIGILVHYQVIAGIKRQASYYLFPFIISYIIVIGIEVVLIFIHMLHMQFPSLDYSFKEESNTTYLFSITVLLTVILCQGFMLKAVCQCRYYLSCKEIHLITLKIAESSRTKYPGIRMVFASPAVNVNNSINAVNGDRAANESRVEQWINPTW